MKRNCKGRVVVDFAGSYVEARSFAKLNSLTIARDEYGKDGIVSLAAKFQSHPTLAAAKEKLTKLGWPEEAQTVRYTES